jgi:hypothetical protein
LFLFNKIWARENLCKRCKRGRLGLSNRRIGQGRIPWSHASLSRRWRLGFS